MNLGKLREKSEKKIAQVIQYTQRATPNNTQSLKSRQRGGT